MMITMHDIQSIHLTETRKHHAPLGADYDYFYVVKVIAKDKQGRSYTFEFFSHDSDISIEGPQEE